VFREREGERWELIVRKQRQKRNQGRRFSYSRTGNQKKTTMIEAKPDISVFAKVTCQRILQHFCNFTRLVFSGNGKISGSARSHPQLG
jgi:hypothetical protein